MLNRALYAREMKRSARLLAAVCAVLTLYVAVIIWMYDPAMMALLDSLVKLMPQLMAAVGMRAGNTGLMGFMVSYLYGFVLLIFPMLYAIVRGNALIAQYVDDGSMVALIAAPVRRSAVALTQALVLASTLALLIAYCTALELACATLLFPGALDAAALIALNVGLLALHVFIGGVCFLASCAFSDAKKSLGFGAGIPVLMYVLQMLANVGGAARNARYFTFFTRFDPSGILVGETAALAGGVALFAGAAVLYALGVAMFCRKDLHI